MERIQSKALSSKTNKEQGWQAQALGEMQEAQPPGIHSEQTEQLKPGSVGIQNSENGAFNVNPGGQGNGFQTAAGLNYGSTSSQNQVMINQGGNSGNNVSFQNPATGHDRGTCFLLVGFPDSYKELKNKWTACNNNRNFAHAADAETPPQLDNVGGNDWSSMTKQITQLQQSFNTMIEMKAVQEDHPQNLVNFAHLHDFAGVLAKLADLEKLVRNQPSTSSAYATLDIGVESLNTDVAALTRSVDGRVSRVELEEEFVVLHTLVDGVALLKRALASSSPSSGGNDQFQDGKSEKKRGCFKYDGPHLACDCPHKEKVTVIIASQGNDSDCETPFRVNPLQLLCAIRGIRALIVHNSLMYIKGCVNGLEVLPMFDCGGTHSFMTKREANRLKLKIESHNSKIKRVNVEAEAVLGCVSFNIIIDCWTGLCNVMVQVAKGRRRNCSHTAARSPVVVVNQEEPELKSSCQRKELLHHHCTLLLLQVEEEKDGEYEKESSYYSATCHLLLLLTEVKEWLLLEVMSSSKTSVRLFGDSKIFNVKNSDDESSSTRVGKKKRKVKRLVKAVDAEVWKKNKHDQHVGKESLLEKEATPWESTPLLVEEPKENPEGLTHGGHLAVEIDLEQFTVPKPPLKKLKDTVEGTVNSPGSSSYTAAAAIYHFGDARNECPILKENAIAMSKENTLKLMSTSMISFLLCQRKLKEELNRALHEQMKNGLLHLSTEQLPLFNALSNAILQMGSPEEITSFPGDAPTILLGEPGEEPRVPDLLDKFIRVELVSDDDSAEEVDGSGNEEKEKEPEVEKEDEPESYFVHQVRLMILDENQTKNLPMYALVSSAMRELGNVHDLSGVRSLEKNIVDAVQAYNVQIHSRLVQCFRQKEKEYQRRLLQNDLDYHNSLSLEGSVSEEMTQLNKENATLKTRRGVVVSPWFLEKFHILNLIEKQIQVRTERFITAMELLKKRTKEVEFYSKQSAILQNLLADREIPLPILDNLDEDEEAKERTAAEDHLLRLNEQDWEIVDLKDKLTSVLTSLEC
ncbi:OLC1v1013481C1 [Oldenlandia corymbosa var. corymbosa]|uniref:OLC1v1013481C1 n=1 Tax=Oldenlandia corymbosa var. corymbosa TaxID=529605 RepID=A0AAV1E0H5_OLDCO|nr:OLC1v1013481C1 [Oldenlandia corymbosa var. corymbosa]